MKSQTSVRLGIVGLGMVGEPLRRYFTEHKGYERGKNLFCFDSDLSKGYQDDMSFADIVFVSVPTPSCADGSCNTSIVEGVIAKYKDPKKIFVIKSTVVPGTSQAIATKQGVKILFNPEFLTEANAWNDFLYPDRQIIGYTDGAENFVEHVRALLPEPTEEKGRAISQQLVHASEAEIAKYAANVFGALKVVFGNVIADYCEAKSARYDAVKNIIAADKRIGPAWLDIRHGHYRGYGGYCFPKDTNAAIASAQQILSAQDIETPIYQNLVHGIAFLEAMRDYNRALLRSQKLDEKKVSAHDHELVSNANIIIKEI